MQAPPYNITTNFEDETAAQVAGRSMLRTPQLDIELQNIQISINGLRGNLALIQADDGSLVDGIVEVDNLSPDVIDLFAGGGTPENLEAANAARDAAIAAQGYAHLWATQAEDVLVNDTTNPAGYSAFHWAQKAQDIVVGGSSGAAITVSYTPGGTISATNVQNAIGELDSETLARLALKADLASPVLTGNPHSPTAPSTGPFDADRIATCSFVGSRVDALGYAPLASPSFSGVPTGPTAAVNTSNAQLATTYYVALQIQNDTVGRTGANASGTWNINISGNAVTASSASVASYAYDAGHAAAADSATSAANGLTVLHSGGSINVSTGAGEDALDGLEHPTLYVKGLGVDPYGRVTAMRYGSTGTPSGNSSIHPDSEIELAGGGWKYLRDIRLGDLVRGRSGPAAVMGIWTNTLQERALWSVNGVACTPGHLFVTENGWGAPSPEHYRKNSYGKRRAVKGRREVIITECLIVHPDAVERLAEGTKILRSDGIFEPVHTLEEYPTEGDNRLITEHQPVIALLLDDSDYFFADGYAVATLA